MKLHSLNLASGSAKGKLLDKLTYDASSQVHVLSHSSTRIEFYLQTNILILAFPTGIQLIDPTRTED